MAVERGCGTRDAGGMYMEVLLSPAGKPIEYFLVDQPKPVDALDLGLTPKGVRLVERPDGGVDVFDWVGKNNYPNVADFVEEVRRFGVSRKLSTKTDMSALTMRSRLVLLHERAYIHNWQDYHSEPGRCPKNLPAHNRNETMCAKLWWEDIEIVPLSRGRSGGEMLGERLCQRNMPSFNYQGLVRPESVDPIYELAIFAVFPIHRIAVIHDPDAERHEESLRKARRAKLPVELLPE